MKTFIYEGTSANPYENLAVEEYLLSRVREDESILYLWQNDKTVVIGKNQNPYLECDLHALECDGGFLARRLSGGGAVFHDLGNLNFTFLSPNKLFDKDIQTDIVLSALKKLGFEAQASGRNDITADGKKISGSAYCRGKNASFHHGAILVDTDIQSLSKYLTVPHDKMVSKGVKSVRSRVANLRELDDTITVQKVKDALIASFLEFHGGAGNHIVFEEADLKKIDVLKQKYSSDDFRIGKFIEFDAELNGRYMWGGVNVRLKINDGVILAAQIFSDAMDEKIFDIIADRLISLPFNKTALARALFALKTPDDLSREILGDVAALFMSDISFSSVDL